MSTSVSDELRSELSQLLVEPFLERPPEMLVFRREADDLFLGRYIPVGRGVGVTASESGDGGASGSSEVGLGGWTRKIPGLMNLIPFTINSSDLPFSFLLQ